MKREEKHSSEKRLIDAYALWRKFESEPWYDNADRDEIALLLVDDAPTVDAVEVVRCRKCKHWKPSGSKAGNSFSDMEYIGGCEFTNYYRTESDFCSYGERKEGAD